MSLHSDLHAPTLDRLGPADVPEVLEFLETDPVLHVYLLALILRDALARPRDEYRVVRRDGRITALLYLGGLSGAVLPAGHDIEGMRLLGADAATRLAQLPQRFQIIGPRALLRALREHFPGPAHPPRLERDQLYLSLAREDLKPFERLPELRPARREDYALVYETGADLRAEELLEDPRDVDPVAYARRVEEDCRDGHTWVWRDARGLIFRAGISALTADAAQISGVYTIPALRGHGVARRGLAELCARVLQRSRHACLFVNDFNAPAIALYRRLGFRMHAEWASAFHDIAR